MSAKQEARESAPPSSSQPCIEIEGLTHTFLPRGKSPTRALEQIDLTIPQGEFVAIVGPSGCGKSTLLRIIAGLLPFSSGKVRLNGHDVNGPQTDLGIVFQSPVLLDWRSVIDNVLVQLELRGLDPEAYRARASELLDKVGLLEFSDRLPRELSGGMRQRTAIVRGLIHNPPILMMDEPFGALDALTREQMRIDLEQIWIQTKKTVLFITHSIDEAVLLADRVLVMTPRPGRVERDIRITMPRPRGIEARKNPEFIKVNEEITEIFLKRGVLHRAKT